MNGECKQLHCIHALLSRISDRCDDIDHQSIISTYLAIATSNCKAQVVTYQTMKYVLHTGRRPTIDGKNADHRLRSIETIIGRCQLAPKVFMQSRFKNFTTYLLREPVIHSCGHLHMYTLRSLVPRWFGEQKITLGQRFIRQGLATPLESETYCLRRQTKAISRSRKTSLSQR